MEINRKFMSEPKKSPSTFIGSSEAEQAVRDFLQRNSGASSYFKQSRMEWVDTDMLNIHLSCANNNYTMAIAMLQLCFVGTNYGYIAYRAEEMAFSILFNCTQKSWSEIVEFLDRVDVNISVTYKGQLV